MAARRHFIFKKTSQLGLQEHAQFRELFARVVGKTVSHEQFERKYRHTPLGNSYHGLMCADGRLVGTYNLVPYRYNCFGTPRLFGLSVDLMIADEHCGGPFNIAKMAALACEAIAQDGIGFVFGFPNDAVYEFTKRVLYWHDIGELDFYALPINIGALFRRFHWANGISRLCAGARVRLPHAGGSERPHFEVEKVCDEWFKARRYDHRHQRIDLTDGAECRYTIHTEKTGVKTLYIIDVLPLTAGSFAEAVRRVYEIAVTGADLILYIGRLPFSPAGLIRVPVSRRPLRIRMCGKVLNPQLVDERVLLLENWSINISNADAR